MPHSLAKISPENVGELKPVLTHKRGWMTQIAWSPNGTQLAVSHVEGLHLYTVRLNELNVPQIAAWYPYIGHTEPVRTVDFNADGSRLVSAGDDGTVRIWSTLTGETEQMIEPNVGPIHTAAFSPDGQLAVCGFMQWGGAWAEINGGELIVYNVNTGAIVHQFPVEGWITAVDFSPSGKYIIGTGHSENYIVIWDIETGEMFRRFDFDPATGLMPFQSIWGPDDNSFLASFSNGITALSDKQSGKPIRYFWSDIIWGLALSPDNRYLVAGDAEGTITIWDFATGEEIRHFIGQGVTTAAYDVVIAPDGQTVFSAHINGPVIQWQIADWPLDQLVDWVHENRYLREFTCEERVRYRIEPLCEQ